MDVRCDKCQARYRVDDGRVGPAGLTMRCGKCGNTFKVTRPAAASELDASAPLPSQSKVAPPPKRPSAAPAANPPESAATMMFAAPTPAAAAPSKSPAKPSAPGADVMGATMVFGQAPVGRPAAPPPPRAPPAPSPDMPGQTVMFGGTPQAARPAVKPVPPPPAPPARPATAPALEEPATEDAASGEPAAADAPASEADEFEAAPGRAPQQAGEGEPAGDDELDPSASTSEEDSLTSAPPPEEGMLAKGPPKGLLIGVGAGVAALLIAVVFVFAWKKMGAKPPPDAAVQALQQAQALADKDSIALFPQALETTKAALAAAPKSPFGEAHATQAQIEIAWADALADLATQWSDRGTAAQNAGDDKQKAEADTKAAELETQAKVHLKAALEAAQAGAKADPRSPELSVALADYYRASHSSSNMNRELRRAAALHADDARIALVQGIALSGDEDTAEKATAKLKGAARALPQSARLHYRLAQALFAEHKEAEALAELKETLRLSPAHERAKAQIETVAAAATPPAEGDKAAPPAAQGK